MFSHIEYRAATNADVPPIKDLIFEVLHEYGLSPEPCGADQDIENIEDNYTKRGGVFEVLTDENGKICGTVGLFPINDEKVELRKMYFSKEIRGRGFGKKTLQRMIDEAKNRGFQTIYLETASPLIEAIGLYKKFGFEPTPEMHTARCDQAYFLKIA